MRFEAVPLELPPGWEVRRLNLNSGLMMELEGPPQGHLRPMVTVQFHPGPAAPGQEEATARHSLSTLQPEGVNGNSHRLEWRTRLFGFDLACANLSVPLEQGTLRLAAACPDSGADAAEPVFEAVLRCLKPAAEARPNKAADRAAIAAGGRGPEGLTAALCEAGTKTKFSPL